MNNNATANKNQRPIRSYVLRQGRMTNSQQHALTSYWPIYGIETSSTEYFDFVALYGRDAPVILEIGFGMGHSLLAQAKSYPDYNYLGIEVHNPGIGHLLAQLHQDKVTNVRICRNDAIEVLQQHIPPHSLAKVQIFFPDPWPKKRHHKRRLIQMAFIELINEKLIPGGSLHIATDWQDYAESVLELLNSCAHFTNQASDGKFITRPEERPLTKFEMRGRKLGHGVWDILFIKR